MGCSPPASSVHGITQAGILESVAISSSKRSFRVRDWTHISYIGRWVLYSWATWEARWAPGTFKNCQLRFGDSSRNLGISQSGGEVWSSMAVLLNDILLQKWLKSNCKHRVSAWYVLPPINISNGEYVALISLLNTVPGTHLLKEKKLTLLCEAHCLNILSLLHKIDLEDMGLY